MVIFWTVVTNTKTTGKVGDRTYLSKTEEVTVERLKDPYTEMEMAPGEKSVVRVLHLINEPSHLPEE